MSNRKTEKFINRVVDQKIVKKTKTGGVKMNVEKTEKVVENAGNSEKVVENAGKVERKAEKTVNGQNGNKITQKNMETIAKIVMQKIESLNIDLNEISELVELARNISDLNVKIQKLSEERLQKLNKAKEIYEKINDEAKMLLEFLGIANFAEIEKVIGVKAQIAKTQTIRAEKGNGATGKKIVYQGKQYNIASYFMRKMGISGGIKGLEEWAKARGYSVKVEDDVIFIV
jgi:hypothetical protein